MIIVASFPSYYLGIRCFKPNKHGKEKGKEKKKKGAKAIRTPDPVKTAVTKWAGCNHMIYH